MANAAPSLFDALWPRPLDAAAPRAFALLDAARDEQIYPSLLQSQSPWRCLYRGDAAVTMAEVAPYLVELDPHSRFTSWLFERAWGCSWSVFGNASVPLDDLRNHFRRLVMAQLPDGRAVYFRFYDPRVLRVYLPTCSDDERKTIFGPVEQFVMEDEHGAVATFTADETH